MQVIEGERAQSTLRVRMEVGRGLQRTSLTLTQVQ